MIDIPGYSFFELLYQGGESVIYRGSRSVDALPVICKILNREYPSDLELSSFRREYEITRRVRGEGAVKAYALEKVDNTLAMFLEDSHGVSLDRDTRLRDASVGERIAFAASAAEALSRIHGNGVIHKDVSPSNILADPRSSEATFIDFGISVELSSESLAASAAGKLEGTIACISPEQTGRMNSPVDFRSDLYSLGTVLYWLFGGRLPFAGKDDLELVYAHIARIPASLEEIDSGIPRQISAIVARLLRKDKEERYQSASGLAKDLRRCESEYNDKGFIADFPLGEFDGFGRFSLPGKLYGRKEEVSSLLEAFGEVSNGASRLLMVSGEPGIGKTTLVQGIHASISTGKAFFASGKFSQLERSIPYAAVIQAFRVLAGEISMMSEGFLEELQGRLTPIKASILELVPDMAAIIGSSDGLPALEPIAAQWRLQLAIREFLASVAGEGRPVVIFIDDMQWCDPSTMELIAYLMGRNGVPHLLVIGAYRDNEVGEGHPLMALLRAPNARTIRLRPLDKETLNLLVADALRRDPESTIELSGVLYGKTGGNPFYANQVLLSLSDKGAFSYDQAKNRWNWDIAAIRDAELGANVIDFLVVRLRELPDRAVCALKAAACIGDSFDVRMLSLVSALCPEDLESGIWAAVEREIITPISGEYRLLSLIRLDLEAVGFLISFKFRHDRLRQAVLSMTPAEEIRLLRSKIGTEMLRMHRNGDPDEAVFEMVNHLNAGTQTGEKLERRAELAGLNKSAGDQAMGATAFQAAADYYGTGLAQMSEPEWEGYRDLRFGLILGKAESVFLAGDPAAAAGLLNEADALTVDDLQTATVSIIRSRILEFKGDLFGAIDEIRRSLSLLGVRLPDGQEDIRKAVDKGIGRLMGALARIPIESLVGLAVMDDPKKAMAMRLLAQAVPAAIQIDYPLYLTVTLTMMDLTLTSGLTMESCKAVADAGILVASMLGDYETGYRLGKAAFSLIDRLKAEGQRPAVYFSFTYVSHMRRHFSEGLEYYGLSYRSGLENGDMQHAMYALSHKLHLMIWVGADLADCERETGDAMAFLAESRGFIQLKLAEIVMQAIKKFTTPIGDPAELEWEKADGERLNQIREMKHMVLHLRFSQYNAFFHYLMGNTDEAAKWNDMAEGIIFAAGTDFPVADHYLVRVLLTVDRLKAGTAGDEGEAFARIDACLATLKKWADSCPENFAHKHLLASAEFSAYRGEPLETTLALYRQAAAAIGPEGFQQMIGLVNELEGRFWLERGDDAIARAFLQDAYYHYGRWGSVRKTSSMERAYPFQFVSLDERAQDLDDRRGTKVSGSTVSNGFLDIGSIAKSVQAISREIKADGLLKTLMGIVMENAGAQKGCILIDYGDGRGLLVEARKVSWVEGIELVDSIPYRESGDLCLEIADYVRRSGAYLTLNNASAAGPFHDVPYIAQNGVKSLLCMPILHQNAFRGILYLENNLSNGVFTEARLEVLKILASQAAISMEIARLYTNMEDKVSERTKQLNEANERLQELTLLDPLTRLNNRRYFLNYIVGIANRYTQRLRRCLDNSENRTMTSTDMVIGVYLVDIDHFKAVNDEWGHAAGDLVLTEVSRALKSIIRADDFIVRWGGEEFLIILNNTMANYLDTFARRALKAVASVGVPLSCGKTISKTCSIGFARLPFLESAPDALSIEQTIMLSDRAMYAAKSGGRNRAINISWKEGDSEDARRKRFLEILTEDPGVIGEFVTMREVLNGE